MRIFLLAVMLVSLAVIYQAHSGETTTLSPIIVSGTPLSNYSSVSPSATEAKEALSCIAGGVDLIEADQYKNGRAVTPQDLLGYSPGIFVQQRDSGAQESRVSIRGSGLQRTFHLRGIKLLQDGIPLNQADGGGDMQRIEPLAIKYTEVFRGGNALRYGSTTLGGAINFVSPTGYDASPLQARYEGGSFGYHHSQLSSGMAKDRGDYYFSLSQFHQDGFRDHTQQDNHYLVSNAGYKISDEAETRFYITNEVAKAKLGGSLTKAQMEANPQQAAAANVSGNRKRDFDYFRLANKTTYKNDEHQLDLSAYWFTIDLFHPIHQVLDVDSQDIGAELRYSNSADWGAYGNQFTLGFSPSVGFVQDDRYTNSGGEKGARTAEADQRAYNLDLYAENALQLTERLTLIEGLQLSYASRQSTDYFQSNGDDSGESIYRSINPKSGVLYALTDTSQAFLNYTKGFEPPSFSELFDASANFLPNKAQRSHTVETGLRAKQGIIGMDATYYHSWIDKELLSLSDGLGNPLGTINARGTTIHQGIELGANAELLKGLVLRGVYNWGDFYFADDDVFGNNQLPSLPAHFFKVDLTYQHPKGFYLGPNVERVISKYPIDMANTFYADPYTIWGLKGGYKIEPGVSLFVEGKNISNKIYASSTGIVNNAAGLDSSAVFNPGNGRAWYGGGGMGMVKLYRGAMVAAMIGGCCFITPAWAHEKREVAGKYEFIVGFINEPAFSGQMNGIDLRITTSGNFGQVVVGAEEKLKVTVSSPQAQGQQLVLSLQPRYKDPGRYAAYFLPTMGGQYIFHIQGDLAGTAIDEIFTSGEKFHDVNDSAPLRFPG